MSFLRKIRQMISPGFKWAFLGLCVLMAAGALLELAALGLVMLLVTSFTTPDFIAGNRWMTLLYKYSGAADPRAFVILLAYFLAGFYVIKNLYGWGLLYLQTLFTSRLSTDLSLRMYRNYLSAPYDWHVQTGSAELISRVERVTDFMSYVLRPLMLILTEAFVFPTITAVLFITAPQIALAAGGAAVILLFLFYLPMRRILVLFGKKSVDASARAMLLLTQGLASVREVKLTGTHSFFEKQFSQVQHMRFSSEKRIVDFSEIPRFGMEAFCIILSMGILIFLLSAGHSLEQILFYAAVFIAGMFRLLPSCSRIQYNLLLFRSRIYLFDRIWEDLTMIPKEEHAASGQEIPLKKELHVDHLTFRYEGNPRPVLEDLSLTIRHCESVAFIGKTGCGKTTLANLIMGFHHASEGRILADGADITQNLASWRSRIGYVPQNIVLFDDTLACNIAFGIPEQEIDEVQLKKVMDMAQVTPFLNSLPDGVRTRVGEEGIRLSGGQRQRIAIARALYRNPELLILDEATSALDNETEEDLIRALSSLRGKLTIIMIAHRLTSIRCCDRVISLDKTEVPA